MSRLRVALTQELVVHESERRAAGLREVLGVLGQSLDQLRDEQARGATGGGHVLSGPDRLRTWGVPYMAQGDRTRPRAEQGGQRE